MRFYKILPNRTYGGFIDVDGDIAPGNCTSAAPPAIPEGSYALWLGKWVIVAGSPPAFTPGAPGVRRRRRIRLLALKRRWPRAKWIALRDNAKANPGGAADDFFDSLSLAGYVDLDDTEFADTIRNTLTLGSIPAAVRLSAEEASAILDPDATDDEEP